LVYDRFAANKEIKIERFSKSCAIWEWYEVYQLENLVIKMKTGHQREFQIFRGLKKDLKKHKKGNEKSSKGIKL
jgi:hypothetical protein